MALKSEEVSQLHVVNPATTKLSAGDLSLGVAIRTSRNIEIGKAMKTAGYDWLFLDLEHSALTLDMASQISIAALDVGIAPLVRVPKGSYSMATRALDNGALGIIIPHVDTADEARHIVKELRLPPLGTRSYSGQNPQCEFIVGGRRKAMEAVEAATLIILMLESPEAIEAADEIAAVDGIDILMIGTNDLCTSMGIIAQYDHPKIQDAYNKVVVACRRHNKWAGLGGIDDDRAQPYIDMGVRFVLAGTDLLFLMDGAARRCKILRQNARDSGAHPEQSTAS